MELARAWNSPHGEWLAEISFEHVTTNAFSGPGCRTLLAHDVQTVASEPGNDGPGNNVQRESTHSCTE